MTYFVLSMLTGIETLVAAALISFIAGYRIGVAMRYTPQAIALAFVGLLAFLQLFHWDETIFVGIVIASAVLQIEGVVIAVRMTSHKDIIDVWGER
ncbi:MULTISPECIES: hypothetical protein [unclassified Pseudovibrio]|uniref:hypothetical protein n=1 Tax=unclassified Pseudovibrio TaxID=2627060 RepID=UPI0007AED95F|nr:MULTISPECIES: hypothetical protein [unclassified Pseudovibrio]KZK92539.1 hypothetical protein PsW74_05466 [Pseudovibrio sp. W74]KZL03196.1 hypothetical protein PsAD14_05726 [Pseudovibrio sp. Ad14]